jgi:hypothetical protein
MRSTLLGLLALALTKSVVATEPPTLESASRTSPYASSLSDYRAWSEAPVGGWRAANEGVQRSGGTHAGHAAPANTDGALQKESGVTPPPSVPPHTGHHH